MTRVGKAYIPEAPRHPLGPDKPRQPKMTLLTLLHPRLPPLAVVVLLACSGLCACATRPPPSVLEPTADQDSAQQLAILAVTNRGKNAIGYSDARGHLSFERFLMSIPPDHTRTKIDYPASRSKAGETMAVIARSSMIERDFLLEAASSNNDAIGIFVHGYNYTFQEALYRLAQISADAKLAGSPLLFSWPSAGTVSGYLADREAALYSRDDLVRLTKSVAETAPGRKIILFGHSVGGFLVMEAIRQLKLQAEEDVLKRLVVVLAAPDIDEDLFRAQVGLVGNMETPITVFVSKDDKALALSSLLVGERERVGRLDVESPTVKGLAERHGLRIVDLSAVDDPEGLGHDRYAAVAGRGSRMAAAQQPAAGAYVADAASAILIRARD